MQLSKYQGENVMDYEKYERECKRIRRKNEKLISDFKKWLLGQSLSLKTIDKHASNVDFYVNEFLLYEDVVEAAEGADEIGTFLGYWFIKKAMWAGRTAIKQNAASLKKFYQLGLSQSFVMTSNPSILDSYKFHFHGRINLKILIP